MAIDPTVSFVPSIRCTGFPESDINDPCNAGWPGISGPIIRDGRYFRRFVSSALFGVRYDLELGPLPDGSIAARLCRSHFTDVESSACEDPDWACALDGTVAISEAPTTDTLSGVRGEIHVRFPDGETLDAVF